MPIDGDTTTGPVVMLDPDGNCAITFTAAQQLGDTWALTTSAGSVLVPGGQFIIGPPAQQSGVVTIDPSYARSINLI